MAARKRKMPAAFIKQQEKMKAKATRKPDSTSRPAKPGKKTNRKTRSKGR